jgi:4-hydroxybenzoate polyprenyltransferase
MFDARRPLGWLFLLLPAMVALAVSAQTLPRCFCGWIS